MAEINYDQLFELLEAGRMEEARKLLDTALPDDLSAEERGRLYGRLASIYWQMATEANENYADLMAENTEQWKLLAKDEQALIDEVDLTAARAKLDI